MKKIRFFIYFFLFFVIFPFGISYLVSQPITMHLQFYHSSLTLSSSEILIFLAISFAIFCLIIFLIRVLKLPFLLSQKFLYRKQQEHIVNIYRIIERQQASFPKKDFQALIQTLTILLYKHKFYINAKIFYFFLQKKYFLYIKNYPKLSIHDDNSHLYLVLSHLHVQDYASLDAMFEKYPVSYHEEILNYLLKKKDYQKILTLQNIPPGTYMAALLERTKFEPAEEKCTQLLLELKKISFSAQFTPIIQALCKAYILQKKISTAQNLLIQYWKLEPCLVLFIEYLRMKPSTQSLGSYTKPLIKSLPIQKPYIVLPVLASIYEKQWTSAQKLLKNIPLSLMSSRENHILETMIEQKMPLPQDILSFLNLEEYWLCSSCSMAFKKWFSLCPHCQAFGQFKPYHLYQQEIQFLQ